MPPFHSLFWPITKNGGASRGGASEHDREEGRKETFTREEDGQPAPPPLALIAFDTVVAAIVADDATCACANWSG